MIVVVVVALFVDELDNIFLAVFIIIAGDSKANWFDSSIHLFVGLEVENKLSGIRRVLKNHSTAFHIF